MKRVVRWVGIGITVAAAATMLMADLLLADTVAASHSADVAITVETGADHGYKDRIPGPRG
ncbi:hypothetical protein KTN05_10385 [Paracoccus sp. Z118]|uniref:hypothetical protein n=1 Tax=Paracoccus sp. Z118 TaxID=2851017 RepID=UPI001C2BD2C3|nr:hypothetical protein [Paracoccus sp. Z118]MBV0892260.1 hypothetical protein [Paracoccus sp. Z118]